MHDKQGCSWGKGGLSNPLCFPPRLILTSIPKPSCEEKRGGSQAGQAGCCRCPLGAAHLDCGKRQQEGELGRCLCSPGRAFASPGSSHREADAAPAPAPQMAVEPRPSNGRREVALRQRAPHRTAPTCPGPGGQPAAAPVAPGARLTARAGRLSLIPWPREPAPLLRPGARHSSLLDPAARQQTRRPPRWGQNSEDQLRGSGGTQSWPGSNL